MEFAPGYVTDYMLLKTVRAGSHTVKDVNVEILNR